MKNENESKRNCPSCGATPTHQEVREYNMMLRCTARSVGRLFAIGIEDKMSIREKLIEFHRAMDVPVLMKPQAPADDRVRLRAALIVEETLEFLEACFEDRGKYLSDAKSNLLRVLDSGVKVDLVEAADALADIIYVVEGTNLEFGINGKEVFNEVHRSNMAKVGGPVREDGKRLKPMGWTPPDIAGVLEAQKNLHFFHSPTDEQQAEDTDLCLICRKMRHELVHITNKELELRKKYGFSVPASKIVK